MPILPSASGKSGKGGLQAKQDGSVVARGQFIGREHQGLAEGVALRPAANACDAIAGEHRRIVMEEEAIAQLQPPDPPILLCDGAFDHLRLHLEGAVLSVERVEDEIAVIARDIDGGPDRIERGEVGSRDEAEHPLALGARQSRRRQRGNCHLQEAPPLHCRPASVLRSADPPDASERRAKV